MRRDFWNTDDDENSEGVSGQKIQISTIDSSSKSENVETPSPESVPVGAASPDEETLAIEKAKQEILHQARTNPAGFYQWLQLRIKDREVSLGIQSKPKPITPADYRDLALETFQNSPSKGVWMLRNSMLKQLKFDRNKAYRAFKRLL